MDLKWEVKEDLGGNNLLTIYGSVRNGERCDNLIVAVAFANMEVDGVVPVVQAEVKNFDPHKWNEFRGEQQVSVEKKYNQNRLWEFEALEVKCSGQ